MKKESKNKVRERPIKEGYSCRDRKMIDEKSETH